VYLLLMLFCVFEAEMHNLTTLEFVTVVAVSLYFSSKVAFCRLLH